MKLETDLYDYIYYIRIITQRHPIYIKINVRIKLIKIQRQAVQGQWITNLYILWFVLNL